MKRNINLTEGSVCKTLLLFTVPVMLSLFLQTMYGAVDLLIVGQFSAVADVTGVTIGSQNMQLLTSVCTGLAVGTTVLIGRRIGEGNNDAVEGIISNTVIIFAVFSVVAMALLLIFKNQLLTLLKTPTEAILQTGNYIFYCTLGIPLIFAYNVLGSVFRGLGDSKTPLIAVTIACFCNIVLDLIFVAVLKMGSAGAAIATVLSQGISVIICIMMMKKSTLKIKKFTYNIHTIKRIIAIGAPIALQSVLTNLSFVVITVIVNQYDNVIFTASVGVAEKMVVFIMLIPIAFMQSLGAYVTQNIGAGKPERASKALKLSLTFSMIFGIIMAVTTFINGGALASIFNKNPEVIKSTAEYMKAYAFDTFFVTIMFCMIGYFNGLGKTTFVMIQGVLGAVMLRIPLCYLFSVLFPMSIFHIGLGTPISTLIQDIVCIIYFIIVSKSNKKADI